MSGVLLLLFAIFFCFADTQPSKLSSKRPGPTVNFRYGPDDELQGDQLKEQAESIFSQHINL
jgi:hypothetical protein